MKKTKATFLAIIFLLALLCAVTIWYGTTEIAYAETTGQDLETLCKEYTADTDLYASTDKSETLDNYESYLETRFQLSNFHNNDRTITDEWIMRIVPKRLFEQKLRNFLYLGESYGFYFDYRNDSNVFIYFFKHDTDPYTSGQLTRRIEPFYYEMYCYDPQSGTASMQHFTDTITNPNGQVLDTQNFYRKYSQAHSLFLKNVSFSGSIYNENHLNVGESGYVAEEDNGAYFFGGSYVFHGVTGQSTGLGNLYFDMLKIGVGLSSQPLGTALSFFDLKDAMGGFIQEATHDFRGEIGNDKFSDTKQFIDLDLKKQIDNLGAPARTFGTITESPNSGASALFGIGGGNYIENTYFYNFANQNKQWNSSMVTRISFDIVENDFLTGTKTIAEHVDSNNMLTSLYDEERIVLTESVVSSVYALPNKTCPLSFVAPYNGLYVFTSQGFVKNQFISDIGEKTQSSDNINQTLMVELQKGQIFNLLTKNLSTDKYSYKVSVKFLPHSIDLGDNSLKLKFDETYIQFTSPKNLNYRFKLDNNADVLNLLNSNFEVVQTSAAGELLAILNANETYYLRIDRSGSETKTVNLTVKDEMYVFFENIEGITSEIPEKITISSTGSVSLPTPEKRGYTFEGWWTNLDAYGENVTNDNIFDYLRPELHLSAKWTPIYYTIFYEENGGDTIPDGDYIIKHVVTLNQNITKAGFVFCGWYDNPELGGVEIKTFPAGNIGNKTFYAKWVKEKFTISFDVNSNYTDGLSATIEESKQVVDFNQNYVLPVPNLDGFIFQGWYFDTVKFTDKNGNSLLAYTNEGNITLTAKWTREKYYIKINANGTFRWLTKDGNDFTFSADKTFVEYEIGLCPNCFVESQIQKGGTLGRQIKDYLYREGHLYLNLIKDPNDSSSLACWKNSELGTEFQNNDTIEIFADYRIESQFKIYISEKEDAGYTNIIYADYDESINYPMPSKAGYTFDYFIVSPDEEKNDVYKNTQFNPGTKFNYKNMPDLSIGVEHDGDAIYLSPVFNANEYNISFTIDGEVWNRKTVTFGESYNSSNGNAFPIPTKTGYKFIGWFSENGIKITDANGNVNCWDIASNCLLKPNWEPNQYKVTFNKQGGSGGTDYVIATYNSEMPYAEKPTLLGHTFMGYFLEIDGQEIQYYTSNMESAHLWDIARDETLKAKWEANQYKITIDYNDGSGRTKDIDVIFGKEIELLPYAPERLGFSFDGAYASPNGVGKKYFYSNDIVYDNDRNDYFENFVSFIEVWDEPASRTIYANWEPYSMYIYPEFYCHGDWSYQKEYRITTNEVLKLTPLDKAGYTFKSWLILEYDPDNNWNLGQNTTICYNNKISYTMQVFLDYGKLASRYQFVAEYTKNPVEEDTCVAEGTLITLSDGTQKAVEDLTGSEQLLVWNLFTGTFDTAPILFIDHDPAREYEVINLAFSDETKVKVIYEHGFWDFDLNEYVFLRRDAAKYIGHWFNKQTPDAEGNLGWTKVQLVNVTIQKEVTTAWSPVTYGHLCYYVNGMLSMPGATEGLINIFDVDPNTLKIDEAKYNADIAEYGLYTYEEFAETYPVPEVIFEAFGGQYLKVSIGKGLIDSETLGRLIERYAKFFA